MSASIFPVAGHTFLARWDTHATNNSIAASQLAPTRNGGMEVDANTRVQVTLAQVVKINKTCS